MSEEKELLCPNCFNPKCSNYRKGEMECEKDEPDGWYRCKCKKCNYSTRVYYMLEVSEKKCAWCGSSNVEDTDKKARDVFGGEYPVYRCLEEKCKKMFVLKEI